MATYAPLAGIPQAEALAQQGALQSQQVQQNALAEYTKAAQEKAQTALIGQQTQNAAQENQARAMQLQDQQTMRQLAPQYVQKDDSGKVTGFDFDGMMNKAAQSGVSPQTIQAMQLQRAQARQSMATATKDERDNQNAISSQAVGMHEDLKGITDPDARQQAYTKMVGFMQSHGLDTSAYPQQVPQSNDDLTHLELPLGAHAQVVKEGGEEADAADKLAKARAANATAAHQEFVNNLTANSKPGDFDKQIDGLYPPTGTAQDQAQNKFVKGQVDAFLSRGDIENANKAFEAAYQNQLGVNKEIAVNTNPQIQAGKEKVASLTAAARQNAQTGKYGEPGDPMIDMVGQGRIDLPTVLSRTPPVARDKFLTNLAAAYPEYQQQVFQTRQALMKSATSGDIGKNITSFNTAIAHATQLQQAADALDNGDLPTLNKVGNALGYQLGSDKMTNFNVIKNALSGEISKVFKGGEATDAEIKAVQEPISAANSPAQLKGAIDNAIHLMNSKRDALKGQVEQGMKGQPNFSGSTGTPSTGNYWDKYPTH